MMNTLYTLGYTGLKPEMLLQQATVLNALIADIRFAPRSRVAHWNGLALRDTLGQRYTHIPELGNTEYKRPGHISLKEPERGVQRVVSILAMMPVILLCACEEYHTCHRRVAADLIRAACGCEVIHLTQKDLKNRDAQTAKPLPRQQTLF